MINTNAAGMLGGNATSGGLAGAAVLTSSTQWDWSTIALVIIAFLGLVVTVISASQENKARQRRELREIEMHAAQMNQFKSEGDKNGQTKKDR